MDETFEQIITEHNDELISIFVARGSQPETPFSGMVQIAIESQELNKRTEARLELLFDKSFLDSTKIGSWGDSIIRNTKREDNK